MFDVDVMVAGGGPAGCATAAALTELGFTVLVADAGVDRRRQLAGELLHPSGVRDLQALGFSSILSGAMAEPVLGFAVLDQRKEGTRRALLPYPEGERGLAFEHAQLTVPLLHALESRPGVRVLKSCRVVGVDSNGAQGIQVSLKLAGQDLRMRARLLVAADGRSSPVRRMLGIRERHERLSCMAGVTVDAALLPHGGFGHIFIGGPAPVLAYAIGGGHARVMVDLPLGSRPECLREDPRFLSGVPRPLREAILGALAEQAPRLASNDTRIPDSVVRHSAVLVGDAAGCCHPLSASGIASCTRDARVLQQALRDAPGDLPRALQFYSLRRRPPQRTRIALASALYRGFSGDGADMQALRLGLFRYWERSRRGKRVSMSLLSTRESSMWTMAREYARVVGYGVTGLVAEAPGGTGGGLSSLRRAGAGLIASSWPHVRLAVRGTFEDTGSRLRFPLHRPPLAAEATR